MEPEMKKAIVMLTLTLIVLAALCSAAYAAEEPEFDAVLSDFLDGERVPYGYIYDLRSRLREMYPYGGKPKISSDFTNDDCPMIYMRSKDLRDLIATHNKIRRAIRRVNRKILNAEMTDKEKVEAIAAYVIDNYDYDEKRIDRELPEAWNSPVVSCAGYTYVYNSMLKEASIDAKHVTERYGRNLHMWSRITLGNETLDCDICWADESADPEKYILIPPDEMTALHTAAYR